MKLFCGFYCLFAYVTLKYYRSLLVGFIKRFLTNLCILYSPDQKFISMMLFLKQQSIIDKRQNYKIWPSNTKLVLIYFVFDPNAGLKNFNRCYVMLKYFWHSVVLLVILEYIWILLCYLPLKLPTTHNFFSSFCIIKALILF